MVWVGRDLIDHPVPHPCHGQGPLPPGQVAQSPVQPGLERFQAGDIHSFSGQPVPFGGPFLFRPATCLCMGFGLRRARLRSAVGHCWLGLSFGCSFFKPEFLLALEGSYCPKCTWWRGELDLNLFMVVMLNSCPSESQGIGTIVPGPLWASW